MKKRQNRWAALLTVLLLIPAGLVGYFLPQAASLWQDRSLTGSAVSYELDPVSLQVASQMTITDKLYFIYYGNYTTYYTNIVCRMNRDDVLKHAGAFLNRLETIGFAVPADETAEYTVTPYLAVSYVGDAGSGPDTGSSYYTFPSSCSNAYWSVTVDGKDGSSAYMTVDDGTGLVISISMGGAGIDAASADADTAARLGESLAAMMADSLGFRNWSLSESTASDGYASMQLYLQGAADGGEDAAMRFLYLAPDTFSCMA